MFLNNYQLKFVKKDYLHHNKDNVGKNILDIQRHILFTKTHPIKTILKLSIAPIVVIIINAIYQLSDVVITAALTDDRILLNGEYSSLATISINTSAIIYIPLWGVIMGVVQGGLAWFTKAQGMQNPKQMGVYNSSVAVLIIIITLIATTTMLNIGEGLLNLGLDISNKTTKSLITHESFQYIWPRIVTLPLVSIYLYSVRSLRILNVRWWTILPYTVGVLLNLLLDYLLIIYGKLGIFGSGLATGISDVISSILALSLLIHFLKKEHPLVRIFSPKLKEMGKILLQGLPIIINMTLSSILFFFTIKWSSRLGALGLSSIIRVINSLAIYPVYGFTQGASIAIGYNFGWKNYKRIHVLMFWLFFIMFTYYSCLTLLVSISAKDLLYILQIQQTNGVHWLRLLYAAIPLLAFADSLRSYYRSTHQRLKTFFILILSTLSPIPFLYVFSTHYIDLDLFWLSYIFGDITTFSVALISWIFWVKRYFFQLRKGKEVKTWALIIKRKK